MHFCILIISIFNVQCQFFSQILPPSEIFCHSFQNFVCILVAVEKIEMKKPPEMTPGTQGSTNDFIKLAKQGWLNSL